MLTSPLRYTTESDVKMRLAGTIIRWNYKAVYVAGTDELKIRIIDNFDGADHTFVHSSDEQLDISSPPLGWGIFTQQEGPELYYVSRGASRLQKQGFDYRSGVYFHPRYSFECGIPIHGSKNTQELIDMINGRKDYLALACSQGKGVLSRDFAISRMGTGKSFILYHRTTGVGFYRPQERAFVFRHGRLTKTRRMLLQKILNQPLNAAGGPYEIKDF